jgi:hypothetical protein
MLQGIKLISVGTAVVEPSLAFTTFWLLWLAQQQLVDKAGFS